MLYDFAQFGKGGNDRVEKRVI